MNFPRGEEQTTGSRTNVYCCARSWRTSVILAISRWADGARGRWHPSPLLGLWCLLSLDVKYTYRFLICIFLGSLDVFYFDGMFSRFRYGNCVLVFGVASGAFVVAIYHVSIPYNQDLYILSGMLLYYYSAIHLFIFPQDLASTGSFAGVVFIFFFTCTCIASVHKYWLVG